MSTKKAIIFFIINTLLLGGFPDFRMNMQEDYRFPAYSGIHTVPSKSYDLANMTYPAQIPSPYELIATPTPRPTLAPTPTPAPTATLTPVPTQVPLGSKKVQSTKPGDLTFQYPEPAKLNTDTATYTMLVNKEYPLSSKYIPYMVEPEVEIYHKGINERRYLQPIAATALEEMFAAAEEDGLHLVLRCGFRSYKLQKTIYTSALKSYGYYETSRYHAVPGASEHQTGLAVDLCCEATGYKNNSEFLKTPEYAWMLKNAHRYGWILRYPKGKEEITGYNFEPWHFRYVGVELATYLKEQDLVLEEYYGALPSTYPLAIPEEYRHLLSKEDYALMMKDIEAFEKKQAEAELQPTPTPTEAPEPTNEPTLTPEPTNKPAKEPEPTEAPELEPADAPTDTPTIVPTPDDSPEDATDNTR